MEEKQLTPEGGAVNSTPAPTAPTGNKAKFGEMWKKNYPDKDFDDEEVRYGQIIEDYERNGKELERYKKDSDAIVDMFSKDPRSASFLADWKNGGDPVISLIRRFGDEFRDALDDPDKQEALAEAHKEYVERVTKEKELEDTYKSNLQNTIAYLDKMVEEGKMSDKDVDDAMEFLVKIVNDGILGKFEPATIEMACKALNHDKDVAMAQHTGEVAGRNAKIEEKLKKRQAGDGLPAMDGKNNASTSAPKPDMGAVDRYDGSSRDIWERGGEKRTKRM